LYLLAHDRAALERAQSDDADFIRAALDEALRLYPPTWMMSRQANQPDTLAHYAIDRDAILFISPWVIHRHPRFWEEPERFRPERFLGGAAVPKPAYLPFARGPRTCVGMNLALFQAQAILGRILGRCRIEVEDTVEPSPGLSLRSGRPISARAAVRA
jgi:cytochrome P450